MQASWEFLSRFSPTFYELQINFSQGIYYCNSSYDHWCSQRALSAGATGHKPRIGLQLYAVRDEFTRDVPGTLKQASTIGFEGVEFWGYGGTPKVFKDYDAKTLSQMLDEK